MLFYANFIHKVGGVDQGTTVTDYDPEGQKLMAEVLAAIGKDKPVTMDKVYEGDACRAKAK